MPHLLKHIYDVEKTYETDVQSCSEDRFEIEITIDFEFVLKVQLKFLICWKIPLKKFIFSFMINKIQQLVERFTHFSFSKKETVP